MSSACRRRAGGTELARWPGKACLILLAVGTLVEPRSLSAAPPAVVSIWGGARHCIILMSNGTVWTWGSNGNGLLGDGTSGNERHTPVEVHGPGDVGYLNSITAV